MDQCIETISCDEICRLCISQQQSINVFSDPGLELPKYSEIILILANVLIDEKDELPKGICTECGLKLLEFYKFREQIGKSFQELELLLKSDSYDQHEILEIQNECKSEYSESNHIVVVDQLKIEETETDIENILNENEFKMEHDEEDTECNNSIADIDDNYNHNYSSENEQLIFENYVNVEIEDGEHKDDETSKDDESSKDDIFSEHYEKNYKEIGTEDSKSDEQIAWKNKLDMWIKKQKQSSKVKKKPTRIYMCDTCGKGWKSQSELARHNIIHTGRRFECTLCQKKFNQMSHLKGHIDAVHYNKRDYQCSVCNMAFSKKYTLTKHMRVHSDQTLYQCQYCPRSFKWQSSLDVHLNSHTGEKPFSCHLCEKSYTSDPALRKHCKRYHNGFGIKPMGQDIVDILVAEEVV